MMKALLLLAAMYLAGCSSLSLGKLGNLFKEEAVYKKDLVFVVNKAVYEGTAIVPNAKHYDIAINSDIDFDLFTASSCHREISAKAIHIETKRKWFGIISKRYISFRYQPNESLEFGQSNRFCPLTLGLYNKDTGQEYWGFIDFKTIYERLPANLYCNGNTERVKGVGICQARAGLKQLIEFGEDVEFISECLDVEQVGKGYRFYMPLGHCVSLIVGKDSKNYFRFTTFGYNRIKAKEFQLD